jgi:hypothetical protein
MRGSPLKPKCQKKRILPARTNALFQRKRIPAKLDFSKAVASVASFLISFPLETGTRTAAFELDETINLPTFSTHFHHQSSKIPQTFQLNEALVVQATAFILYQQRNAVQQTRFTTIAIIIIIVIITTTTTTTITIHHNLIVLK